MTLAITGKTINGTPCAVTVVGGFAATLTVGENAYEIVDVDGARVLIDHGDDDGYATIVLDGWTAVDVNAELLV